MADSKKYNGSTWEHSLRKLTTATDTLTTLPIDLYADGNNATVGLKGNMSQSGIPTPDNPIQPSGCGDLETTGVHAGQYKIPISSANATTPVYLGEVESVRRIKKLVLDGTESFATASQVGGRYRYSLSISLMTALEVPPINCTHFRSDYTIYELNNNTINNATAAFRRLIYFYTADYATDTEFKAYLQQQYANGTPVTVWYVLANPETGILNEPLRKIGSYADTVSGLTIPTITGKDTIDVETTLKPSEVSLSYTGWHDANVQEWDGSQWNE